MFKFIHKSALAMALAVIMAASPCVASARNYGDANDDGKLTSTDAALVLTYTLNPNGTDVTGEELRYYDVTGDGLVSAQDSAAILAKVLNSSYVFPRDASTSGQPIEDITLPENDTVTIVETTTETTTVTTTETTAITTTEETTTETTTASAPENGIKINGTVFTLGQSESTLPTAYSVGTTPDGLKCYSYSEDYEHYTRIGVKNGVVVSIVTFDVDAEYDGQKIGGYVVPDSVGQYDTRCNKYKSNRKEIVELFYDANDKGTTASGTEGVKIYSIVITSPSYLSGSDDYSDKAKVNELCTEIFDMTNAFRAQHGITDLIWNSEVALVAQDYAQVMVDYGTFSHTGPDGSTLQQRLAAKNIKYSAYAENIDAGYFTAEGALNGWITSSGHRANLLSTNVTHLGVGAAYSETDAEGYGTRFVQDYIRNAR